MDTEMNKYLAEEYNQEAHILYSKGEHSSSVKMLVKILALDPLNEKAISALTYYCLRPLKEELSQANITDEIIKLTADSMHKRITKYPQEGMLQCGLYFTCAKLYTKLNDRRMGFYYFSQAWRAEPDQAKYPVEMARILINEENYGEAIMLIHHALELDPTCGFAYFLKGCVEIKCNRNEWAKDAFENFLLFARPEDPVVLAAKEMIEEIVKADRLNIESKRKGKINNPAITKGLPMFDICQQESVQTSLFQENKIISTCKGVLEHATETKRAPEKVEKENEFTKNISISYSGGKTLDTRARVSSSVPNRTNKQIYREYIYFKKVTAIVNLLILGPAFGLFYWGLKAADELFSFQCLIKFVIGFSIFWYYSHAASYR